VLPRNLYVQSGFHAAPNHLTHQFIFELKVDGFRAFPHRGRRGELIYRKGNRFRGFAELAPSIARQLRVDSAMIDDGEIDAWMQMAGWFFSDLLCPAPAVLFLSVFDLLFLNGKDLRTLSLIERKAALENYFRKRFANLDYIER
jgi:bifunctional non-homologous end joining protein LigD